MTQFNHLRALLEKEQFPQVYVFKFIGKNTPEFESGVQRLEHQFANLVQLSRRESGKQNHVSMTYQRKVEAPQEVIEVLALITSLPDVVIVL